MKKTAKRVRKDAETQETRDRRAAEGHRVLMELRAHGPNGATMAELRGSAVLSDLDYRSIGQHLRWFRHYGKVMRENGRFFAMPGSGPRVHPAKAKKNGAEESSVTSVFPYPVLLPANSGVHFLLKMGSQTLELEVGGVRVPVRVEK